MIKIIWHSIVVCFFLSQFTSQTYAEKISSDDVIKKQYVFDQKVPLSSLVDVGYFSICDAFGFKKDEKLCLSLEYEYDVATRVVFIANPEMYFNELKYKYKIHIDNIKINIKNKVNKNFDSSTLVTRKANFISDIHTGQLNSSGYIQKQIDQNEEKLLLEIKWSGEIKKIGLKQNLNEELPDFLIKEDSLEIKELVYAEATTCALYENGDLKCWGSNAHFQVRALFEKVVMLPEDRGDSSYSHFEGENVVSVVSDGSSFCRLNTRSEVYCWGSKDLYWKFRTSPDLSNEMYKSNTSIEVKNVFHDPIIDLFSPLELTYCVLKKSGRFYCWGSNEAFNKWTFNSEVPIEKPHILDFKGEKFLKFYKADSAYCSIVGEMNVKCWGHNYQNKVNKNTKTKKLLLASVFENLSFSKDKNLSLPEQTAKNERVKKLTTTQNVICALFYLGEVACWGNNRLHLLGHQTRIVKEGTGEEGTVEEINPEASFYQNKVALMGPAKDLVSSEASFCVLLDSGKVQCWGRNRYGILGKALDVQSFGVDNEPSFLGEELFVEIYAFRSFYCGITQERGLKCWGDNFTGVLGQEVDHNYTGINRELLDQLTSINLKSKVKRIFSAYYDKTLCAHLEDHTLKCWGSNPNGLIGQGTNRTHIGKREGDISNLESINLGPRQLIKAYPGHDHICTVHENAGVKCWGANTLGKLGHSRSRRVFGNEQGDMESLDYLPL